jgi:hypothetical protein
MDESCTLTVHPIVRCSGSDIENRTVSADAIGSQTRGIFRRRATLENRVKKLFAPPCHLRRSIDRTKQRMRSATTSGLAVRG